MMELINRADAIKDAESWVAVDEHERRLQKNVIEWLKEFPLAEHGTNLAEVGTDCISRQQAIDYFVTNVGFHDEDGYPIEDTDELRKIWTEYFSGIQPAQPKRGRWIKLDMHRGMADHKCTACKQECYVPTCMGEPMYAYCPNCGADMRGEQDG